MNDDHFVIEEGPSGRYDCNACSLSYASKGALQVHRAKNHGLKSSEMNECLVKDTITHCPVSGLYINMPLGHIDRHVIQCKIDRENKLKAFAIGKDELTREYKCNSKKMMLEFSTFNYAILKDSNAEKDLPLFHHLMIIFALRPGFELLNGAGFFNICKANIKIEDGDKLIISFQCKTVNPIIKEARIDQFLVDIINLKRDEINDSDLFFCNRIKDRILMSKNYCKNFNILPQMCRPYRATLELQHALQRLVNETNANPEKAQIITKKLQMNLNETGVVMLPKYFIQYAFESIGELLSHETRKQQASFCPLFNPIDLYYIDERLLYCFFKNYLDEKSAKLFIFRLYRTLHIVKTFEEFSNSNEHNWAFEPYEYLDDPVIQPYLYANNWINSIFH